MRFLWRAEIKTISIKFCFLIIVALTIGCKNVKENKIIKANVVYLPGSWDIEGEDNCRYPSFIQSSIDTIITSQDVLDSTLILLSELQPMKDPKYSVLVRISCILHKDNGDSLILNLGMFDEVCVNYTIMENNIQLSRLIKRNIGYYEHFAPKDLKWLKYYEVHEPK